MFNKAETDIILYFELNFFARDDKSPPNDLLSNPPMICCAWESIGPNPSTNEPIDFIDSANFNWWSIKFLVSFVRFETPSLPISPFN